MDDGAVEILEFADSLPVLQLADRRRQGGIVEDVVDPAREVAAGDVARELIDSGAPQMVDELLVRSAGRRTRDVSPHLDDQAVRP